jgi:four helix bundle protein
MYPAEELKNRSKQFAIRIVKLFRSLPKSEEARIIGKQVLRSGTSIAANYRAICRARSLKESNELLAIFAASQYTARKRRRLNQ